MLSVIKLNKPYNIFIMLYLMINSQLLVLYLIYRKQNCYTVLLFILHLSLFFLFQLFTTSNHNQRWSIDFCFSYLAVNWFLAPEIQGKYSKKHPVIIDRKLHGIPSQQRYWIVMNRVHTLTSKRYRDVFVSRANWWSVQET